MRTLLVTILPLLLNLNYIFYGGYGAHSKFQGFKLGEIYSANEIVTQLEAKGFHVTTIKNSDGTIGIPAQGKFKICREEYDGIVYVISTKGVLIKVYVTKTITYPEALEKLSKDPEATSTSESAVYARMHKISKEYFETINDAFDFYYKYILHKKTSNDAEYVSIENKCAMHVTRSVGSSGDKIELSYVYVG